MPHRYRNDAFQTRLNLSQFARPGSWNDPDSLIVGLPGLTLTQQRTHFTMWALMNAPLIAGNRLDTMSPAVAAILMNRDVIGLNQDRLAIPGRRVQVAGAAIRFADVYGDKLVRYEKEVWAKPLESRALAIALVNHANSTVEVEVELAAVGTIFTGIDTAARYRAKELWTNETVAEWPNSRFSTVVEPMGVMVFRLDPVTRPDAHTNVHVAQSRSHQGA